MHGAISKTLSLYTTPTSFNMGMDPLFIGKEKIASLLTMAECIEVMDKMFRSLANGKCLQPLRSFMRMPDKSGLLGMMPGYAEQLGVMGIKVISVFHANKDAGYPSHQGVVILFDARHGQPLMMFDASEVTAIRTAAASALATRLLSRPNSQVLAVIGSGEQAVRHIESIMLTRKINQINLWGRNEKNSRELLKKISISNNTPITITKDAREAVGNADIICTVTSSSQPLVLGDWICAGTHINAVGSSTPGSRELDSAAVAKSKLFTDCYESLFNEAGDFLIPKKEGAVKDDHVRGELGEVLTGTKQGRQREDDITVFKSLGIAAEDIFACWHIYQKITA